MCLAYKLNSLSLVVEKQHKQCQTKQSECFGRENWERMDFGIIG